MFVVKKELNIFAKNDFAENYDRMFTLYSCTKTEFKQILIKCCHFIVIRLQKTNSTIKMLTL